MPSDVWSLGCILYLMIYRRTPYQHLLNTVKIQKAIRAGDPIKYDGIQDQNLLDCLQVHPLVVVLVVTMSECRFLTKI